MSEHININDPRIDEIKPIVENLQFDHIDPKGRGFRFAIWQAACQVEGFIDQRDPAILREVIDTVQEQIGPHSGPGDPDSPEEEKYR